MSVLWQFLACESLHVCTVSIWRCERARFCVEVFYALYINIHSFIDSFIHSFIHIIIYMSLRRRRTRSVHVLNTQMGT